ncbi:MAG: hypothetical protein UV01_C0006G0050 [Parcubacteria group bacterium GW2011_GWA2_42_14]|nr:MAG: hypothetical protein UV01_C0006G0050 [Parcubacteria group bacterium GW2011_GWA2_42_14]
MAVVYVSWPLYRQMDKAGFFPEPRIEITGFQPNEQVIITRPHSFSGISREAWADKSGKAVFHDLSPGNWVITKGGTEKLQKTTIYIPDRYGIFIKQIEQFEIRIIFQRGG